MICPRMNICALIQQFEHHLAVPIQNSNYQRCEAFPVSRVHSTKFCDGNSMAVEVER
jgi:hypothetical protein